MRDIKIGLWFREVFPDEEYFFEYLFCFVNKIDRSEGGELKIEDCVIAVTVLRCGTV